MTRHFAQTQPVLCAFAQRMDEVWSPDGPPMIECNTFFAWLVFVACNGGIVPMVLEETLAIVLAGRMQTSDALDQDITEHVANDLMARDLLTQPAQPLFKFIFEVLMQDEDAPLLIPRKSMAVCSYADVVIRALHTTIHPGATESSG